MKAMTFRALGGACDLAHHGATADDVTKAQDGHLREAVAAGVHTTHEKVPAAMKGRWRRPICGMSWCRDVKRRFAELLADSIPTE